MIINHLSERGVFPSEQVKELNGVLESVRGRAVA